MIRDQNPNGRRIPVVALKPGEFNLPSYDKLGEGPESSTSDDSRCRQIVVLYMLMAVGLWLLNYCSCA